MNLFEYWAKHRSRHPVPERKADDADHSRLPQLDSARIAMIWSFRWFDGPLHGMAEYKGKRVWFDFHHWNEEATHYFYTLYPLTDAQVQEAELWLETCGRYDAAENRLVGRDEKRHDANWSGPNVVGVEPLGWFMDGPNADFYAIKVHPTPTTSNRDSE